MTEGKGALANGSK